MDPHAKLIAPAPRAARTRVVAPLTTKTVKSIAIRRPCRNSRVITPCGTQARPSMTTARHSTRTIQTASSEPSAAAIAGAAANSDAYSRTLLANDSVSTVGANLRTSPSHRTTARLTPISFADRSTFRTSRPTAYRPHSPGPRKKRANTTPEREVADPDDDRVEQAPPGGRRYPAAQRTLGAAARLARLARAVAAVGAPFRIRCGRSHLSRHAGLLFNGLDLRPPGGRRRSRRRSIRAGERTRR
jgi:hypothetical protein